MVEVGDMEEGALLSMAQAAARLKVHPNTLRKWADEGRVPVVRRPGGGGYRRFEPHAIDAVRRELGLTSGNSAPGQPQQFPLLTPQQAAARIGITVEELDRWVQQGSMHVMPLPSGEQRFHPDDVERARRDREMTARTPPEWGEVLIAEE